MPENYNVPIFFYASVLRALNRQKNEELETSILNQTINEIKKMVMKGFFISLLYVFLFLYLFLILSSFAKKRSLLKIDLLKSGTIFNDFLNSEDISQFY